MDDQPLDPPLDASPLIRELEGHLLVEAARAEGRAEAERFARSLPWLSDTQRREVQERYATEHLVLARRSWQHVARRGGELRAEYEDRYRRLRRRWCAGVLTCAALAVVSPAVLLLTGARG
ncbi:hypothetical protein [Streptomyces sp. Tue6028]|uniref:hypothetical protein n=1 Tax=Streptomyces sp. Tue6028 TaxID=2036037 RepID=UPI003D74AA7E